MMFNDIELLNVFPYQKKKKIEIPIFFFNLNLILKPHLLLITILTELLVLL